MAIKMVRKTVGTIHKNPEVKKRLRGVNDILTTVTDNLNGFTVTINNVFPESQTQICVIHQIRNSASYVVQKDKKEFADTSQIGMAAFIASKRSWIDYIFKDKAGKDDFSQLKMPLLAFKCPDSQTS